MGEPIVADTESEEAHVLGQSFEGHLRESLHLQLQILLTSIQLRLFWLL